MRFVIILISAKCDLFRKIAAPRTPDPHQPARPDPTYHLTMDRRQDRQTADHITEALRMKRAFGLIVAERYLWRRGVRGGIVPAVLAGRYERRVTPDPH